MSRFEHDTAVRSLGGGRYLAEIDTGWWIINGPNGGYIAAIVGRAIESEVADGGAAADGGPSSTGPSRTGPQALTPQALTLHSLTVHYLRPPVAGPALLEVTVERRGRSVVSATARMSQDDRLLVLAVAAVAGARPGHEFDDRVPPAAPAPEDLPPAERPTETGIAMTARYAMLPCLGSATESWGPDSAPKPAVSGGWIRFADTTPIDAIALAAISDAWFPPVFHRLPGAAMAVPTVDLTVHVLQLPADPLDWVLARFSSPQAVGGYLVEDGEIWERHGRLLAVSRQLAVLI